MSRTPRLTDAVLRAALALEPAVPPTTVLGAIASEVRTTAQERGRLVVPSLPATMGRGGARGLRPAWVLVLATALLLAFAGGVLVGAQLIRERLVRPAPAAEVTWSAPPVVDLPPAMALEDRELSVAPVSADEAWVADGRALWHYKRGAWGGPFSGGMPTLTALDAAVGRPLLGEIAVAADGTVWGVTVRGLARWDGQRWELVIPDDTIVSVRVAPDGTVWAGTLGGDDLYTSPTWRLGEAGTASPVVCGISGRYVTPAADGSVYVAGTNWGINHQLWRIDGGSCIRLDPPWDGTSAWADAVLAQPDGSVVMALRERDVAVAQQGRLVRFDGARWTDLGEFGRADTPSLFFTDPAGGLWRLTGDGGRYGTIERFDAGTWYAVEVSPSAPLLAAAYDSRVAPDGSIWFPVGFTGLARLIPTSDPATQAH